MPLLAESLSHRTAVAGTWRAATSAFSAIAQFLVGVILARLLEPADFGVMALVFVVLGFARCFGDLGVGNAIVQRADLTERHVRVGFTVSVLLGVVIAAVLIVTAPLAAFTLNDAKVVSILRVLSAGFVVGGTAVVAGALLRRQLDFKSQFVIDVAGYVLGYACVTCALAWHGYGVWSLVYGGLMQTLISSAGQLICARHSLKPLLTRQELADLLHFGFGSAVSAGVNYVALNADNLVVGRSIGTGGLGLYNRAYALMNMPYSYAASVMSSVLFPAVSRAQRDTARVRRAFLLLTRLTALIAGPAMITLAIVAANLVRTLYGERWIGVVAPLRMLCIAGYFRALYHLGGIVAQSAGYVYRELANQALYATLVVAGALVGARFGLPGVAVGVSVAILCMFLATGQLALTVTFVSWREYFRVQILGLVTGAMSGCAALFVQRLLEARRAPSAVVAGGALAAAAVPWAASILSALGEPAFAPLRTQLAGLLAHLRPRGTDVPHPADVRRRLAPLIQEDV